MYGVKTIKGNININEKYALLFPNTFLIVKKVNKAAISTIIILNVITAKNASEIAGICILLIIAFLYY